MHGELLKVRCPKCYAVSYWDADVTPESQCPSCGAAGVVRPHVVWFGEVPLGLREIVGHLGDCAYFVMIGSSGYVYPASMLVMGVPPYCRTIVLNMEPAQGSEDFNECHFGPATETVPAFVSRMLEGIHT
jgi:NAD-dependent deacetylase